MAVGATAAIEGSPATGSPATGDDPAGPFRRQLADWLADHLTPDVVAAGRRSDGDGSLEPDGKDGEDADGAEGAEDVAFEVLRHWNRILADAGWAAVAWPARHHGRDATVAEQLAWHEEMARVGAPGPVNVIGVSNIAPAIMAMGTDEQRDRFLWPMLRGDEVWSQGMSEPDAGSDLASLRTTATLDGGTFVVNGQKTWNSLGSRADWCQLYVRTDPQAPRHKGISCLLVDMRSPGIEVRPLRTMAGDRTFSELFFDDVAVPRSSLLGPLHGGWKVAMTTLSHERAGVARLHLWMSQRLEGLLGELRGHPALAHPRIRARAAAVYARIACMRWSTTRELEAIGKGAPPSPGSGSLTKLMWSQIDQELSELAVDALGLDGALWGHWSRILCASRQASIAGGTTEINRNIVAEQALGLPR